MPLNIMKRLQKRAVNISKTLGYRAAAGFLRRREVEFADAIVMLTGRSERFPHLAATL